MYMRFETWNVTVCLGQVHLQLMLGKWWESVDWMHLVQVRDWWRAVVNTVMSFRLP